MHTPSLSRLVETPVAAGLRAGRRSAAELRVGRPLPHRPGLQASAPFCILLPMIRYDDQLAAACSAIQGDRAARMQQFVDLLWDRLRNCGVSWLGFYLPDGGQMTLGPRRDKPACSPIGMHGACGQAFRSKRPLVVRDVADLGENYVACDPRDRSEIVIPLLDTHGAAWGVLDLDSYDVGAFDESDVRGLERLLIAAGLTHPRRTEP